MKKKVLFIIVCFLCLGFIVFNSSQPDAVSNLRSNRVTDYVINIFSDTYIGNILLNKVTPFKLNIIIRKLAHAFEFWILAIALSSMFSYFKLRIRDVVIYTLFIVLFIAVMDEFFQLFIVDRTSSVTDVLIDFCGGICAEILFLIFSKLSNRYNGKHSSRHNRINADR